MVFALVVFPVGGQAGYFHLIGAGFLNLGFDPGFLITYANGVLLGVPFGGHLGVQPPQVGVGQVSREGGKRFVDPYPRRNRQVIALRLDSGYSEGDYLDAVHAAVAEGAGGRLAGSEAKGAAGVPIYLRG